MWSPDGVGAAAPYNKNGVAKRPELLFAVLWEVQRQRDSPRGPTVYDRVFLEVDASRHEENATLNALKRELVTALMDSDLRRVMQRKGYGCDESYLRRTDLRMRQTRTTSVFKVIPVRNIWPSPEEPIKSVHADLGVPVNDVVGPFVPRLNEQFVRLR